MTDREAMQQAQQEPVGQKPVAWQWLTTAHFRKRLPKDAEKGAWNPLYTTPPRREWVGLTLEEIGLLTTGDGWAHLETPALLKEKNK